MTLCVTPRYLCYRWLGALLVTCAASGWVRYFPLLVLQVVGCVTHRYLSCKWLGALLPVTCPAGGWVRYPPLLELQVVGCVTPLTCSAGGLVRYFPLRVLQVAEWLLIISCTAGSLVHYSLLLVLQVVGCNNVWTKLAVTHEHQSPTSALDWEELEGLFCVQAPQGVQPAGPTGNKGGSQGVVEDSTKPQNTQVGQHTAIMCS